MTMKTKKLMALAIGAAFGIAAQGAHAAITVSGAAAGLNNFAKELANDEVTLTNAGSNLDASAPITSFGPSAAQQLIITVSLDNGAKFAVLPSAVCDATTGGVTTFPVSATWNLGGAGTSTASFSLNSAAINTQLGSAASISGNCVVAATSYTNVTGNVSPISMTVGYQYGSLGSSTQAGTLITFGKGVSASTTVGSNVAEVTSSFTTFTAASSSTTTANIGTINWNANGAASAYLANGTTVISPASAIGTATITLTGPALAAARSASGIYLVSAAAGCATGTVLFSAATAASPVTFNVTPTDAANGVTVCMTVSGAAIPADTITASITATGVAGTVSLLRKPDVSLSSSTVGTITRNGASATVMNLPRAADGTDTGSLRIYNTSSLAGPVTATIYSQGTTAGASSGALLVTGCQLTSSLGGNQALTMSSSQLEAAAALCSGWVTPTSGRYRIEVAGAFPSMKVQAFSRSAGVLTNITPHN